MAKKEFTLKGKSVDEILKMSLEEFAQLLPSRQRRSLKRGFTPAEKSLLKTVRRKKDFTKPIRTHVRGMIIIPELLNKRFAVYDGKDWNIIDIKPDMLGHYLGEFSYTRERVSHSGPGIGATRGTKFTAVK